MYHSNNYKYLFLYKYIFLLMKKLSFKYHLSIIFLIIITYLSCFRPPHTSLSNIPNFDKYVHILMYMTLSFLIWFEFICYNKKKTKQKVLLYGFIRGCIFPIFFGSMMEVVQKYMTTYRSFEWNDILSDAIGSVFISIIFFIYIYKFLYPKQKKIFTSR